MTADIKTTTTGIKFLRTPDDRFADLPDFPFLPRYIEIDGLRMAYLDEGPKDGTPLLLLHGEPAWSYLYRRMIPPLVDAGYRCIAPDLIGFGRSDKPIDQSAYTYANHIRWVTNFLDKIELSDLILFAQDWGGLIGLRLVTAMPDRFERVAIGNTALPVGESLGQGFSSWLEFSQGDHFTDIGELFGRAVVARELSATEREAYNAPFPSHDYMAGAKVFPTLVPITPEHAEAAENREAWKILCRWTKPFLTLWCPGDPVLGHLAKEFIDKVPGAVDQPHRQFEPGGHFIQDDHGESIAANLIDWLR